MSKIVIRDGKFYKGNVEVKPEFGNREQIQALRDAERKASEERIEAKLIEQETITYYATVKFTCPVCKEDNEVDLLDDDPIEMGIDSSDVDNLDISCPHCDTDFTIEADKGRGNMGISLIYDQQD
jgi:hypothetical protein